MLNGTGAPGGSVGHNGDFYLDTAADVLYGPKAGGTWPTPGTSLIGNPGATGPAGPAGPPGPALSAITDLNGVACTAYGGGAGTIAVGGPSIDSNTLSLSCNPTPTCTHSNGVGQNYTDCPDPLGVPGDAATYSIGMALDAANAYIQANGGTASPNITTCGDGSAAVEVSMPGMNVVWDTTGRAAGHVLFSVTAPTCPTFLSATWN